MNSLIGTQCYFIDRSSKQINCILRVTIVEKVNADVYKAIVDEVVKDIGNGIYTWLMKHKKPFRCSKKYLIKNKSVVSYYESRL